MNLIYEQKNKNILDRFENKTSAEFSKSYNLTLTDGKSMTVVDMQNRTYDEMLAGLKKQWGNRFEKLEIV
jgi:hypothetical protein